MDSVQSYVRAKVRLREFPSPEGAEAFSAYAIASGKRLIPEMENAARQTLNLSMTFENLGEGLRLFDGCALQDLANFRKRCRDSLIPCLDLFLDVQPSGPSSIWVGCLKDVTTRGPTLSYELEPRPSYELEPGPTYESNEDEGREDRDLPGWLNQLLLSNLGDLNLQKFTHPLDIHSRICGEYTAALQDHGSCLFCLEVHLKNGSTFCTELRDKLAQALDKVTYSFTFQVPRDSPLCRYALIAALSLV